MRRLLLSVVACLVLGVPALADYQAGMTAYRGGDFKTALSEFQVAAEAGDGEAQAALGIMYVRGEGVEKDLARAAEWLAKSAEQGHVRAQHLMGRLYHSGSLGERDVEKAVAWFEKAAEGGNIGAHLALTSIYYKGDGVEKNLAKAAKHVRIAAEGGVVNAQMHYARMLLNGEGLTRDPEEAYFWLYIAMQKGQQEAVVLIRQIGKDEVDTAARMAIESRANLWQPAPPKAR